MTKRAKQRRFKMSHRLLNAHPVQRAAGTPSARTGPAHAGRGASTTTMRRCPATSQSGESQITLQTSSCQPAQLHATMFKVAFRWGFVIKVFKAVVFSGVVVRYELIFSCSFQPLSSLRAFIHSPLLRLNVSRNYLCEPPWVTTATLAASLALRLEGGEA